MRFCDLIINEYEVNIFSWGDALSLSYKTTIRQSVTQLRTSRRFTELTNEDSEATATTTIGFYQKVIEALLINYIDGTRFELIV